MIAIIGSGNWGSAIAKIVGRNVADLDNFEKEVTMWVFQEQVDGKNLTDIINTEHENVKYLPVRIAAARRRRRLARFGASRSRTKPSQLARSPSRAPAGHQVHGQRDR